MRYGGSLATLSCRGRAAARIALAAWLGSMSFAPSVCAEVRVSGAPNALTLEARGATLDEVLRALGTSFKLQYQGSMPLTDAVNGTYSGSLRSVVVRLLTGHDYIMHGGADNLSVDIVAAKAAPAPPVNRASGARPAAAAAPPPAAAPAVPEPQCIYKDGDRIVPVEC